MQIRVSPRVSVRVFGFVLAAALSAATLLAEQPHINATGNNLALRGYDAVAYVTDGKAVKGDARFQTTWNGVTWRFASAAHRDQFVATPEKYAPQYGGYCAYAVSQGHLADGDPEAWKIVDGKLYVNYSKSIQKTWQMDIPGYIKKADTNWPNVLK